MMRAVNILAVATVVSLHPGLSSSVAMAGWFGPSTYNECVVDEMKNQSIYMMPSVKSDCRQKFCKVAVPSDDMIKFYRDEYMKCEQEPEILSSYFCNPDPPTTYTCK